MLKFTKKHKEEEIKRLEAEKNKISKCVRNLKDKTGNLDIKESSNNVTCITSYSIIKGCQKQIKTLNQKIEGIKASLESSHKKRGINTKFKKSSTEKNITEATIPEKEFLESVQRFTANADEALATQEKYSINKQVQEIDKLLIGIQQFAPKNANEDLASINRLWPLDCSWRLSKVQNELTNAVKLLEQERVEVKKVSLSR